MNFLEALKAQGFKGDIATDYATRIVNATDNSIYQCLPDSVIAPKTEADIALIAKCIGDFPDVKITPRGGGTGTNGQSLNNTIIVDFSKHLRGILDFNKEAGTVTVEPGVILDQLNAFLKTHGLFFPATVSPSNRATLGGMVSTDACGKGSRIYGKTSDYIVSMEALLPGGGSAIDLAPQVIESLKGFTPPTTRLPRGITGYNLYEPSNIYKLLAGSEGTLALIKRITLKVLPLPKHKVLGILTYSDFLEALEAVPALLALDPHAIETLDDKVLSLARADYMWHEVKRLLPENADSVKAIHFIEFVASNEAELETKIKALPASCRIVRDNIEMASLWSIRKRCVGLLGNAEGNRRPIPFIEDTAVPPENLPDYIRELSTFLDSHKLTYGMFGHVDAGCLHVRPALDLRLEQDAKLIRILSDGVANLVQKYGGVIWGEHGKGLRGEYTEQLLGKEYVAAMQRIKTLFDPHNQLNPGKLVNPTPLDAVPLRGEFDRQIKPELNELLPKATQCNGNGACFNYDTNDAMCPSYKVTGNRIHSPKGRAGLLREWARLESIGDKQKEEVAKLTYEALDGCLSCKACTAQCPIKVNIPDMKSRFLSFYHRRNGRPLKDYLIAYMEPIAAFGAKIPFAANLVLPLLQLFGLRDLPRFSTPTLASHLKPKHQPPATFVSDSVILVQDAFTSFFDAPTVIAIIEALERMGKKVYVAPFKPNGKPMHVKGFLDCFTKVAKLNAEHLNRFAQTGIPLVGVDASITLTYRQEYADIAPVKVLTLDEYLSNVNVSKSVNSKTYRLFTHCTEKTAMPEAPLRWKKILESAGHQVELVSTGCCGMAGAYGHEAQHKANSEGLYDLSWRAPMEAANGNALVTGFSCRCQVKRFGAAPVQHPLTSFSS